MASVLTARYAPAHRVRSAYDRLPDHLPTLAEAFRRAGYRTAALVSDYDLDHVFRFDRGFESYDDRYQMPVVGPAGRRLHLESIFYGNPAQDYAFRRRKLHSDSMREDAQTTDAAVGWLRRAGPRPFFLWVHYFGAHERRIAGGMMSDIVAQYQSSASTLKWAGFCRCSATSDWNRRLLSCCTRITARRFSNTVRSVPA